jgi:S1-C subfamily serine protease
MKLAGKFVDQLSVTGASTRVLSRFVCGWRMRRAALYSSAKAKHIEVAVDPATESIAPATKPPGRWRQALRRYTIPAAVVVLAVAVAAQTWWTPPVAVVTQRDIDRAVRESLEKKPLPSKAAKAYEVIRPSVVRVMGFDPPQGSGGAKPLSKNPADKERPEDARASVGTGVVITEAGAILTNLHVIDGTSRIVVTFFDGSKSEAFVKGVDADNDLAVLQAKVLPDDLQPATLVTTGDLAPGDEVVAVGYPFGFGPSASAGIVSGLRRDFYSADGKRALTNLIQFDAAANPGNSGGPLVNMNGEVLGIVTAILNPLQQHFFVGLGFAVPIENAAMAVGIPPF